MRYLDTYVLAEIAAGNDLYKKYVDGEFVISDLTLAEFYWVLLRDVGEDAAEDWFARLQAYAVPVARDILRKAMVFRFKHKKQNLSFFDCVGYVFALENDVVFVTGDKEFRGMNGVEFTA